MTQAVITLYRDLPDKDVDELVSLLDEAGIDAEIGPPHVRMGPVLDTTVQLVVESSLGTFIGALVTAAGAGLWKGLRGVFERDGAEREQGEVVAVIVDPQTGDRVELTGDALRRASLPELLDLVKGAPGERAPLVIVWDEAAGTWQVR